MVASGTCVASDLLGEVLSEMAAATTSFSKASAAILERAPFFVRRTVVCIKNYGYQVHTINTPIMQRYLLAYREFVSDVKIKK